MRFITILFIFFIVAILTAVVSFSIDVKVDDYEFKLNDSSLDIPLVPDEPIGQSLSEKYDIHLNKKEKLFAWLMVGIYTILLLILIKLIFFSK